MPRVLDQRVATPVSLPAPQALQPSEIEQVLPRRSASRRRHASRAARRGRRRSCQRVGAATSMPSTSTRPESEVRSVRRSCAASRRLPGRRSGPSSAVNRAVPGYERHLVHGHDVSERLAEAVDCDHCSAAMAGPRVGHEEDGGRSTAPTHSSSKPAGEASRMKSGDHIRHAAHARSAVGPRRARQCVAHPEGSRPGARPSAGGVTGSSDPDRTRAGTLDWNGLGDTPLESRREARSRTLAPTSPARNRQGCYRRIATLARPARPMACLPRRSPRRTSRS